MDRVDGVYQSRQVDLRGHVGLGGWGLSKHLELLHMRPTHLNSESMDLLCMDHWLRLA